MRFSSMCTATKATAEYPRPRAMRLSVVALLLAFCPAQAHPYQRSLQEDGVGAAVMGGYPAKRGRYPWMASLHTKDGAQFCGGALIGPRLVVTAAHCIISVDGSPKNREAHVRLGGYNLARDRPGGVDYERIGIDKYWAHSLFPDNPLVDLALLALARPSTRQPARLPPYTPKPALPAPAGTELFLLGWGATGVADSSNRLQEAKLRLAPTRTCQRLWGFLGNWTTLPLICAGNVPAYREDACRRDSGGPLFTQGRTAKNDTVLGIVNTGQDCSYVMNGWSDGKPGVYTSLASLIPWIEESAKVLLGGTWTGSVLGDPRVTGFDGSKFTAWGRPGQTLKMLTAPKYNLTGVLRRVPGPTGSSQTYTALRSVTFRWHGDRTVQVQAERGRMAVSVNSVPIRAGTWLLIRGGRLRFNAFRTRVSHQVTIAQRGVSIRILQPFTTSQSAYAGWLDVWVTLTEAPGTPLGGVLGRTFRAGGLGIASGALVSGRPLTAALVAQQP